MNNNNLIQFYDSYGGNNDLLTVCNANNKFLIYLSDFSFQKDNDIYNISLGKKGDCGQYFRFQIGNTNYVTDNVWYGGSKSVSPIKTELIKINYNDINKNDILLNNANFSIYKESLIEYMVDKIKKQNIEDEENDRIVNMFWENKNLILKMADDGGQWILYLIEERLKDHKEYRIFISCEPIICYLYKMYSDYLEKSEELNIILMKFCNKIIQLMEGKKRFILCDNGAALPLGCSVGSKEVFEFLNKYFEISSLNKNCEFVNSSEVFLKEISYSFNIYHLLGGKCKKYCRCPKNFLNYDSDDSE